MKKSVYSIVLSDDVVDAVDRLAVRQGMSRSGLINQILAEKLCCETPEKQIQSVFSVLEKQMNELFRIQTQASDAMMSMHSALRYKYRPALRYSVELLRQPRDGQLGWLRVSCRTQNSALIAAMEDFFRFRIKLEIEAEPEISKVNGMYELAPGRITRRILYKGLSPEQSGEAISMYINQFDEMMQLYFAGMNEGVPVPVLRQAASERFGEMYRMYGMLI